MKHLKSAMRFSLPLAVAMFVASPALFAADPPKEPAYVAISVSPEQVAPGGSARVTVRIQPKAGVKINRYPKIKLQIPAQDGVVDAAQAEIGNDRPPAPDKMDTNYYKEVDALELDLHMAEGIAPGRHELDAKLTYFYCIAASGFCAPARIPVKIAVEVR